MIIQYVRSDPACMRTQPGLIVPLIEQSEKPKIAPSNKRRKRLFWVFTSYVFPRCVLRAKTTTIQVSFHIF